MTVALADRLADGRRADERWVGLITHIFSDTAARHGEAAFRELNPLVGAISGDPSADIWRTWLSTRRQLADGRAAAAFEQLRRSYRIHRSESVDPLAAIERWALLGQTLTAINQPHEAIETWSRVRADLLARLAEYREAALLGPDIRTLLRVLTGADVRDEIRDADLVDAWVVARGVALLQDAALALIGLLGVAHRHEAMRAVAEQLESDLVRVHDATGLALYGLAGASVSFALGDCWTAVDPDRAIEHFRRAAAASEYYLTAEFNVANCLIGLGRFAEAQPIYAALVPEFERTGDLMAAARARSAACVATWKQDPSADVHDALVDAVSMFEENLPMTAELQTLHTLKQHMESGYTLLISVLAEDERRDEALDDELIAALWALLRPELRASLDVDTESGWDGVVARAARPLATMRLALDAHRDLGVVHLCSATDRFVVVGYGYDADGLFRVEAGSIGAAEAEPFERLLAMMHDQLVADQHRDPVRLSQLDDELMAVADAIGETLPAGFAELVAGWRRIYYAPVLGGLAAFPLHCVRLNGHWLGERCEVLRSPSPNHVRELLAPDHLRHRGGARALIVMGDPTSATEVLHDSEREGRRALQRLRALGFAPEVAAEATYDDAKAWFDSDVAVLHYIGHGVASDLMEGLPLGSGEMLTPEAVSPVSGSRTPFVFLCSCDSGLVRHAPGGYSTGMASRLVEHGAPGAVAFTMPMTEARAYSVARAFYREAAHHPLGAAMTRTQTALLADAPVYASAAFVGYGDHAFELPSLAGPSGPTSIGDVARSWHSTLRAHAVLRTPAAYVAARERLVEVPPPLRGCAERLLEDEAAEPPLPDDDAVADAGVLSLRALATIARCRAIGLDAEPIRWPHPGDETRELFHDLLLATQIAAALFDTKLSGLASALLGRLVTWDQNSVEHSRLLLEQANDKLAEVADVSPYANRLQDESRRILRQFGALAT